MHSITWPFIARASGKNGSCNARGRVILPILVFCEAGGTYHARLTYSNKLATQLSSLIQQLLYYHRVRDSWLQSWSRVVEILTITFLISEVIGQVQALQHVTNFPVNKDVMGEIIEHSFVQVSHPIHSRIVVLQYFFQIKCRIYSNI